MADVASCGTYQDLDAAIAALVYHQAAATGKPNEESAEEAPTRVQHLHLSCCDIDNEAVGRISVAIREAPDVANEIESVNLGWNDILADCIPCLVSSLLPLTGLAKLDLNYNSIGDDGAKQVAQLIQDGSSLTFLDLVKNSIQAPGVQALAEALGKNRSLKALHLGMNQIGDEGLMHLAGALTTNETLLTLDIEVNQIGAKGVEELAVVLTDFNRTLTAINLQDNQIGDEGAVALAKVLEHSETLGMLDIRTNQITGFGCGAVAAALSKSVAPFLDLDIRSNSMEASVHSLFEELHKANCEIQVAWDFSQEADAVPVCETTSIDGATDDVSASAVSTVERMLGLIEDEGDVAFDNATWYLTTEPELADLIWQKAHDAAGGETMIRCLEIFHNLLQHSIIQQGDANFPLTILHSCSEQLPALSKMLQSAPEEPSLTTTFGVIPERFGSKRLCVVDLISDLIETQSLDQAIAVCKSGVLQIILDQFFKYEWHNLLHCCVLRIMSAVLNNSSRDVQSQEATNTVRRHIFLPKDQGGCGFLERMLEVYQQKCPLDEHDQQSDPSASPNNLISGSFLEKQLVTASLSCGYMNVIVDTAMMLQDNPEHVSELQCEELADRWDSFSESVLGPLKPIREECLGGGVPPQSAAPQCSQM